VHPVEADIRNWSHNFLEIPNVKLNGLPPCPYARKAWADNQVKFSINTGLDGLREEIEKFDTHKHDIVVWADEDMPPIEYLDGWCDGMNEAFSVAGIDLHLMVFHPEYDASEAGLDFLDESGITSEELVYCMIFVQRLSILDDAAISLEKSGYYKHFPEDTYQSLVIERRKLRNGNG